MSNPMVGYTREALGNCKLNGHEYSREPGELLNEFCDHGVIHDETGPEEMKLWVLAIHEVLKEPEYG